MQLVFIIGRFSICKFIYWLNFLCNAKINTHSAWLFADMHMHRTEKTVSQFACSQLTSYFSSHSMNKFTFFSLFSAMFCIFVLLVILLFKMDPGRVLKS